jgi:RNA polymerase sigma-70 factor (ECF subfamily)
MSNDFSINKLTDNLFRHESGKMVSVLCGIFGIHHLELAEDVVQQTFLHALNIWKLKGIPDNPSAWLYRVAKNKAIDAIRKLKHSTHFDFDTDDKKLLNSEYTILPVMEKLWSDAYIKDDVLRMMYVCCHPGISPENQITLILKTLCGFSTTEISRAFLTSEDTISKRLYRTREYFRNNNITLELPSSIHEYKSRTNAVLNAIYLLFNEGYKTTHHQLVIREELIDEAFMLCKLLLENEHSKLPEVNALLGLMSFHRSRLKARLTDEGCIILIEHQDRKKWDSEWIELGIHFLNEAASGDELSTYHLEAAIAFEHCTAPSFEATNWIRILQLYTWLQKLAPSPVVTLNQAVAIKQVHGAEKALSIILEPELHSKLKSYYLYHCLLGDLYAATGRNTLATTAYKEALTLTNSAAEQNLINQKIRAIPLNNP